MKRFILPIVAAFAAAAMATAAQAATYVNYGTVGADGGFSINFGNNGITTTAINDTFEFTLPTGRADFVITSTMSGTSQNITWSSITVDGDTVKLVLKGTGGGNASYSGLITFMPTATGAVPEPASWALMIGGFGAAGAMLRRTRRDRATGLPVAA